MTPDEQRLLADLLTRLRRSPAQPHDAQADAEIARAVRERPDLPYLMAQTILMQDFALRDAQARIATLEQQHGQGSPAQGGGSFLGGLMNRQAASPPRGPWGSPSGFPGGGMAAPMTGMPAMQSGGFLRSAAATAAGVVGGALLLHSLQGMFGPDVVIQEQVVPEPLGGGSDPAGDQTEQADTADLQDADYDPGTDPGADMDTGGDDWI